MVLDNSQPTVHNVLADRIETDDDYNPAIRDEIDKREIFDIVRNIADPEHPLTLEQLNVVRVDDITVDDGGNYVQVKFTPTIPHCSMATLIGLAIRTKLHQSLASRFKIEVCIAPGTHQTEEAINKQLGDKERVAAALENPNLRDIVLQCLMEPE